MVRWDSRSPAKGPQDYPSVYTTEQHKLVNSQKVEHFSRLDFRLSEHSKDQTSIKKRPREHEGGNRKRLPINSVRTDKNIAIES